MKLIVDLTGVSGAVYRFHRFEGGQIPATGGNFAHVQEKDGARRVVGFGRARSLIQALAGPNGEPREAEGDLYVRLNVVAALQDSEYEDLVGALPEPFARCDLA